MIKDFPKENHSSMNLLKHRFPLWISVFFLLIFSIPFFAYFGFLQIAKIIGVISLLLVIFALRFWLITSKRNSSKRERFVLNRNQQFELERKYYFLKYIDPSLKQTLFHRTGLLLAELIFMNEEKEITSTEIIEIAFNCSIILSDYDYQNFNDLKVTIGRSSNKENQLSLSEIESIQQRKKFSEYKSLLNESIFTKNFQKIIQHYQTTFQQNLN